MFEIIYFDKIIKSFVGTYQEALNIFNYQCENHLRVLKFERV